MPINLSSTRKIDITEEIVLIESINSEVLVNIIYFQL